MNAITNLIKSKETEVFKFTPNNQFFKTIEINRKRWGLLMRGQKDPTITELKKIADFFEVSVTQLID
jgi:hypothetical protein